MKDKIIRAWRWFTGLFIKEVLYEVGGFTIIIKPDVDRSVCLHSQFDVKFFGIDRLDGFYTGYVYKAVEEALKLYNEHKSASDAKGERHV